MVSRSLVLHNCWRWPSTCLSILAKAASAFFLSLFASVSLTLRSLILYSATVNASTAVMRRPSSSFICLWASSTHSSAIFVVWIALKKKKKKRKKRRRVVKINSLRAKIAYTLKKKKRKKNTMARSLFRVRNTSCFFKFLKSAIS